jgi:hypothetical protein
LAATIAAGIVDRLDLKSEQVDGTKHKNRENYGQALYEFMLHGFGAV